ncbi:type II secretion system secretin GspD [Aquimonas voraii]|uniref:General secretion pathway protein D n=1 Tax=Aquimonas voraii TaxID=265719 RepID=A0A1G6VNY9_9GAMM|nr:type II secretion system secretin GspD [Aquimonas voraii]SDD55251.1 general secretion pathway protein D [Aquimonas voraii]
MRHRLLTAAILFALALPASSQTPAQPTAPTVMIPQVEQTAAAEATQPGYANGSGRHTLNLKAADINVLIETVSEITGKSFIVDQSVTGAVTVVSRQPMTADEIYEVFLSVLRVHGYTAVPAGSMVKIVPDVSAAQQAPMTGLGGGDAQLTRIIDLKHVSAQEMIALLRPLMPQQAHIAAHGGSNSLLVADRASNLERIAAIIRRIDVAADAEVEVIPLRHARASEIARTLLALESGTAQAAGGQASTSKVLADERTNSLLLSGDRAQRLRARSLIVHLDTPLDGGEATQVVYLRNAKAEDLVPVLDGVAATLTGYAAPAEGQAGGAKVATIQAHAETNALVISAAPAVFRELETVIRQLDVRRAQVQVEAIIAEVSDELASELGVQWQSADVGEDARGVIGGTNFGGAGGLGGIVGGLADPRSVIGGNGLNIGYLRGSIKLPLGENGENVTVFQLGALVKALRGDGRANVLSSPSIVTLDHQEAEIKVVQEVPFLTGQYTNTSTNGGANQPTNPFQTIDRRDVGVILTVTPHVNEGDAVRLELKQEVSALAPQASGAVDLITNKRELSTTVLVPDGGLLVLGGLTSEEATENVQGVPGLSRIPLLGNLFKSRGAKRNKRTLMVFLRPTILRDAVTEAAVSSEKYNYIRAEQLQIRERAGSRIGGQEQPLLPELPRDLFQAPPPVQNESERPQP